jgi:hypothetical protein
LGVFLRSVIFYFKNHISMPYLILLLALLAFSPQIYSQNMPPQIDNAHIVGYLGGQCFVTFSFDVSDAENDSVIIKIAYSTDGGVHFYHSPTNGLEGDVLVPIAPGAGKYITWSCNPADSLPNGYENMQFKIIATDRQPIDIQTIVDAVDTEQIIANMGFVEGTRHYTTNPTHIAAIKDTLDDRFTAAGLQVTRQPLTGLSITNAENIIGTLPGHGSEQEVCIVDAHFDSVSNAPGADDNGSGVIGVLEAMRVLAPYNFERSLRFIGFDLEELGLLGSIFYVSGGIAPQETIKGVLNYEMIGYYSDAPNSQTVPAGFNLLYPDQYAQLQADQFRGNFLVNVANTASNPLKTLFDSCALAYVPDLKVMSLALPGTGTIAPDFRRSDHAPFWDTNRPALMLTDGANFRNPNYHTTNDVSSVLDFEFMTNNIKATVATIATLAKPIHSTAYTTPINEFLWWVNVPSVATSANGLTVSPNPASGQVRIAWAACMQTAQQPTVIYIYDTNGKQVRRLPLTPNTSETLMPINTLAAGTYYVTSDKGHRQTLMVR